MKDNRKDEIVDENGFILGGASIPVASELLDHSSSEDKPPMSPAERRKAGAAAEASFYKVVGGSDSPYGSAKPEYNEVAETTAEAQSAQTQELVEDPAATLEQEKTQDALQQDKELRDVVVNRAKSKDKKKRKKPMKRKKEAKPGAAWITMRILLSLGLIGLMCASGLPRIQAAIEIARTSNVDIPSYTSSPSDNQPASEPVETVRGEFKYIDEQKLEKLSSTELAIWFLTEFPIDKAFNSVERTEFNTWLSEQPASVCSEFEASRAYVSAHPELLHPEPVVEEPEAAEGEDQNATPGTTTAPATATTTPASTPTIPQTYVQPNTGSPSAATPTVNASGLPADMDSYSAAQVANWVYATFPMSRDWTIAEYSKLTAYYDWLNKKPASFSETVSGYLDLLGWSVK